MDPGRLTPPVDDQPSSRPRANPDVGPRRVRWWTYGSSGQRNIKRVKPGRRSTAGSLVDVRFERSAEHQARQTRTSVHGGFAGGRTVRAVGGTSSASNPDVGPRRVRWWTYGSSGRRNIKRVKPGRRSTAGSLVDVRFERSAEHQARQTRTSVHGGFAGGRTVRAVGGTSSASNPDVGPRRVRWWTYGASGRRNIKRVKPGRRSTAGSLVGRAVRAVSGTSSASNPDVGPRRVLWWTYGASGQRNMKGVSAPTPRAACVAPGRRRRPHRVRCRPRRCPRCGCATTR